MTKAADSHKKIGLLATRGGYVTDALVVGSGLLFGAVDIRGLGLPEYSCPYGLSSIRSGETVVISSSWLAYLRQLGINVISQVLRPLRERFERIVGIDHADPFLLCLPDEEVSLMDVVLKVNGVYNDPDFNNYIVGAPTSDGRWAEKSEPREQAYQPANLRKMILSIPCFLGITAELRAKTRRYYCKSPVRRVGRSIGDHLLARLPKALKTNNPPRSTVHFFASLTHVQRATAVRKLKQSSLRWKGGLTSIPQYITGFNGTGMANLSSDEQRSLKARLSVENMLADPLNRFHYQQIMADCKAVLSITGYGELCFRMAEAWANRRVLVCQDLSHARTLFPLQAGRNVVYCRPDLSDLIEILEDIECNFPKYIDVAEQGYQDWLEWSQQSDRILQQGFAPLYKESNATC
jgi:hypothetical protein